MSNSQQLELFQGNQDNINEIQNWGTFKDSLREPVHRWFTYPAGFSYKAVTHSIERFGINPNMVVYDPFMGSGTTNLTCKSLGISSYGVEAHPFVYKIAKTKMNWEVNRSEVIFFLKKVENIFLDKLNLAIKEKDFSINNCFPELVIKCYSDDTLKKLYVLKILLQSEKLSQSVFDFFLCCDYGFIKRNF